MLPAAKKDLVAQLLEAKQASGKTYTEISKEIGLTNLYTAQLFQNQVPSSLLFPHMLLMHGEGSDPSSSQLDLRPQLPH